MNRGIEYYAWVRAEAIAREALSGRVYRPVGLALNYHTTAIRPYWAPGLVRQAVVGSHIFYRRPGTTEGSFIQTPGEEVAPALTAAPRTVAVHSAPGREGRAQRVRDERVVMEIPVVERPVRFRTVGAQRTSATRPASRRGTAATHRGTRVSVESGVRVARGS
jgi:hypothetical protein